MADSIERIADELDLMAESVQAMSPATKERKLHNIATRLRDLSPAGGGEDDCEVLDAAEALMRWCVKNVKKWHLPEYDRLHAACERRRAALAASPQQEPGACPHIVQSKEGTAYCRLAESAGASGGGEDVEALKWVRRQIEVARAAVSSTIAAGRMRDHYAAHEALKQLRAIESALTTPASPAAPQPQKRDTGIDAAVERGDLRNTFEPPAHGDVNDPSGQTLAGAGGPLLKVLADLLDHVDRETCTHEEVHRGGAIWTICDSCGRKWADDEGGFVQHEDAPAVAAARAALTATSAGTTGDDSEDAARYRWLRDEVGDNGSKDIPRDVLILGRWMESGQEMDEMIDDARRARGEGNV